MTKVKFRFVRICKYCGREFRPEGRMNKVCPYCKDKSYELGRMLHALISFRRILRMFGKDKEKPWYKRFQKVVKELGLILKEIQKEMKHG